MTFSFWEGHLQSNYKMYPMSLYAGTKYEVCRFNRNWDKNNFGLEIHVNLNDIIIHSISMKLKCGSTKGISKRHTPIFFSWSEIRDRRSTVVNRYIKEQEGNAQMNHNKRATPKWVTKSCDNWYVGEIASKLWTVFWFLTHFGGHLTLTFDRSSTLGSLNEPYWVVPWYQVWSL